MRLTQATPDAAGNAIPSKVSAAEKSPSPQLSRAFGYGSKQREKRGSDMAIFTVFITKQTERGDASKAIEVEAGRVTVGPSGNLEFWRVTEHGDALFRAIARGYWLTCEEKK